MMKKDCLFCSIADSGIGVIAESDNWIVINDIRPKAPVHLLAIPKSHHERSCSLSPESVQEMWKLLMKLYAERFYGCDYKIIQNNGIKASQTVMHVHFHFLVWN